MTHLKKVGRVALKLFAWIAGIYLLVLFAAGIYINSKKKEIMQFVSQQMEEKLHGKASISDLDISVWHRFPNIAFSITGFSLSDSLYNKPLLSAQKISTTFSLFRLISSNKSVKNLIIEDGEFHLFTDSNGYSNKYLLQLKKKNVPVQNQNGNGTIEIDKIAIRNFLVMIEDRPANKEISMLVNKLQASVEDDGKGMNIKMKETITMKKGLGFNLSKGAYVEGQTLEANWDLQLDKTTKTLSFEKTTVKINDHPFIMTGKFVFDKTNPLFSISFDVKDLAYENANKIITAAIREKTGLVQMKGPLDIQGSISGSLLPSEPAVNINWQTKNNTLITPVVTFDNCSFSGNFMNSVHKDSLHTDPNSKITFYHFEGDWDGVYLGGKNITITNLLEPRLHFSLHSDCKLEALDNKFALKDILFKGGTADLNLFYDGPLTKDNIMLEDLEGQLNIKDGMIEYVPRSFVFTNCNGDVGFFKDSISMRKFTCSYLNNKLEASVEGRNIRRKFVNNDISQEAVIKCMVRSSFLNLEDFNPLFAPVKQRSKSVIPPLTFAATARKLDALLVNSIIDVDIKATAIKHGRMQAQDFDANIKFLPHHWELAKVSVNLAGGTIYTTGKIMHNNSSNHAAAVSAKISNVDVSKLLYAFDNFGQDIITHKNLQGNFSTTASLKAGVNYLGKIVPSSLYGSLNFSLKNGALESFEPFEKMKNFVFKNRDMKHVRFAELKNRMDISAAEVFLHRMEIQSSVVRMFIEGNYDLKGKNTDLLIQVPLSNLNDNSFTDGKAPKNKGTSARTGMSVWLRAENEEDGKVSMKFTLRKKLKDKKKNEKLQRSLAKEKEKAKNK